LGGIFISYNLLSIEAGSLHKDSKFLLYRNYLKTKKMEEK